jgi:hypothetical protein
MESDCGLTALLAFSDVFFDFSCERVNIEILKSIWQQCLVRDWLGFCVDR